MEGIYLKLTKDNKREMKNVMEEKVKKEWAKPEVSSLSVNKDTEGGAGAAPDGTSIGS